MAVALGGLTKTATHTATNNTVLEWGRWACLPPSGYILKSPRVQHLDLEPIHIARAELWFFRLGKNNGEEEPEGY